jgi:glucan-binding YG repeat protein
MVTGWQKIDGKWYWFSSGGVMFANGDKTLNGKTYHFDQNGVCTNP